MVAQRQGVSAGQRNDGLRNAGRIPTHCRRVLTPHWRRHPIAHTRSAPPRDDWFEAFAIFFQDPGPSATAHLHNRGSRASLMLLRLVVLRDMHVASEHLPQFAPKHVLSESVNHP